MSVKNNPPRCEVYEGESYILSLDESKPNDHFQEFMRPHIGKVVKIRKIRGVDDYGYRIVHIHGELSHICWREYDFIKNENESVSTRNTQKWGLEELFTI